MPESGELPELLWEEITSGLGHTTLFCCYVEPGAKARG